MVETDASDQRRWRSALGAAASNRRLAAIDALIAHVGRERGVEHVPAFVNLASRADGCTPLMRACYGGHADVVTRLIEHRAELEALSGNGEVALHIAAREGYTRIVRELVAHDANVDVESESHHHASALMLAAECGHLEACKALIEGGASVNHTAHVNRETALIWACKHGHNAVANCLIEQQCERLLLQHRDAAGLTALHHAANGGYEKCVTELFREDVELNAISNEVCMQTGQGSNHPSPDAREALSVIWCVCMLHDLPTCRVCLACCVCTMPCQGATPLMLAAGQGHLDVVRTLAAHPKIDLARRNDRGQDARVCSRERALEQHHMCPSSPPARHKQAGSLL